jgi:hypothetical protein
MKKINFENLNERNDYQIGQLIGGIKMEFIKYGDKYVVKNSGGKVVSEKEKLQMEKRELIFKDIESGNCQGETTKKIKKIDKKIKEAEAKEKADAEVIEETDTTI